MPLMRSATWLRCCSVLWLLTCRGAETSPSLLGLGVAFSAPMLPGIALAGVGCMGLDCRGSMPLVSGLCWVFSSMGLTALFCSSRTWVETACRTVSIVIQNGTTVEKCFSTFLSTFLLKGLTQIRCDLLYDCPLFQSSYFHFSRLL